MKYRKSNPTAEDVAKTLYVRLPHTIKSMKEIQDLFVGDVTVKLPRQSSRHCHVIFPSVEEKIKNMKSIRKKKIDGKRILAAEPKINLPGQKKIKEKKIRPSKPAHEPKITQTLHVSNVRPGTKPHEIKTAFPGCTSVVMVKSENTQNKIAIVKLRSLQLAGEYLRKERKWPEVRGQVLRIQPKVMNRSKKPRRKVVKMKIYDGEGNEIIDEPANNSNKSSKVQKKPIEGTKKSEEEEEEEKDVEDDEEEDDDEEEEEESDESSGEEEE